MLTISTYEMIDDIFEKPFREHLFETLDEIHNSLHDKLQEAMKEVIETSMDSTGFFIVNNDVQKRGFILDLQVQELETIRHRLKVSKFEDISEFDDSSCNKAVCFIIERLDALLLPETNSVSISHEQSQKVFAYSDLVYKINRKFDARLLRLLREIQDDK